METRAGRSATGPRTEWFDVAEPGWFTPLAELAFGPHLNIPRYIAGIFRFGDRRLEFTVPPMSDEWLERYSANAAKHTEQA
jgi:hypothetical protein